MNDSHNECRAPQEIGPVEGRYANYFKVEHNAFEFLFGFGQRYLESEKAQLHTRIITSPIYATARLETLRESIGRYEQIFGTIRKDSQAGS